MKREENKETVLLYLEHERCGGRREVESLPHVGLTIVLGHVALNDNSLGCSLLSNQQNSLGKCIRVKLHIRQIYTCTDNGSSM